MREELLSIVSPEIWFLGIAEHGSSLHEHASNEGRLVPGTLVISSEDIAFEIPTFFSSNKAFVLKASAVKGIEVGDVSEAIDVHDIESARSCTKLLKIEFEEQGKKRFEAVFVATREASEGIKSALEKVIH